MGKGLALLQRKELVMGFAILIILPWLSPNLYIVNIMVLWAIYSIISLGLSLFFGFAGQISLGHAAFFGIGAYSTAILTTDINFPVWPAFCVSVAFTAFIAFLIGLPILKLKEHFLALATLGFGEILSVVLNEARFITHGTTGITDIPPLSIGSFSFDSYVKIYYLAWFILMSLLFFSHKLIHSRVGRAFCSLSSSEVAASCLGIDTQKYKLKIFILSAVYAATAGNLYAFSINAVSPSTFDLSLSILLIMMVIIGGLGNLWGAVIGAGILTWLSEFLSSYQEYSLTIYGFLLIVLLLFMPRGVIVGWKDIIARLKRLRSILLKNTLLFKGILH